MSNTKKIFALAAVASVASVAQAANISITPVVTGAFDASFNPIPVPANNAAAATYQVDFYLGIGDLGTHPGATGLGSTGFDIKLNGLNGGTLTKTTGTDWTPNNPTVDTNGAAPGGSNSLFLLNTDGGTAGDLQFITVSMAGGSFSSTVDPRYWVGQSGAPTTVNNILAANSDGTHPPFKVGTAYVDFNGVGTAKLDLNLQGFGLKISGTNTQISGYQTSLGSVNFGAIPEPASLSLVALAGLAAIRRRRA